MTARGARKEELDTPALLLDLEALERNIAVMSEFFAGVEANLRPHIKTHKCPQIAQKQIEAGAKGITCAKLGEAEAMVEGGIDDILIANQVVGAAKIQRLIELAKKTRVTVAVDDAKNVQELSEAALGAGVELGVLVEVNVGMDRCGAEPGEHTLALARRVSWSGSLAFRGLMGYEGHAVSIRDPEERKRVAGQAMRLLLETVRFLEGNGLRVEVVSAGGTGTYDITGKYPRVTEIQAGSYVVMDTTYRKIKPEFEQAMTALATVISRPSDDRAIIDCGKKSLSTDFGLPEPKDLPGVELTHLSEEHGTLKVSQESPDLQPGQKIELLPSHCCTTINLFDNYYLLRQNRLEAIWPIAGRGKST